MSRNQRFSQVLFDKNISQTEYARRIGVSSAAVNAWCNKGGLGIDPIERLLVEFPDVDARWLITGKSGEGDRLNAVSNHFNSEDDSFSHLNKYLVDDIKRLNDEVRRLMTDNGGLRRDIEYLRDNIKNLTDEKEKLMIENQELRNRL